MKRKLEAGSWKPVAYSVSSLEREPEPDLPDPLLGTLRVAGERVRLQQRRIRQPRGRVDQAAIARVVLYPGFNALNRLNTSPIASTRMLPRSRNDFDDAQVELRLRQNARPQFTVSHAPDSSIVALCVSLL